MAKITDFSQLDVYQNSMDLAMILFHETRQFPAEEKYSLVDQIRRCSRSVCANIGEAWRKRRYPAAFVAKLIDSAGEANETLVWLELSWKCGYMSEELSKNLHSRYRVVLAQLQRMIDQPEVWQPR